MRFFFRVYALMVCALSNFLLCAQSLPSQPTNQEKITVSGTVSNSITNEPLRAIVDYFNGQNRGSVMSGTDGHFQIDGIAPGPLQLTARRTGFAAAITSLKSLTATSSTDSVSLKLPPFGKISGRILDREGEPIDGVQVQCFMEIINNGRKQIQPRQGASSDETGRFVIEDLPAGNYYLRTSEKRLYRVAAKSEAARYIYPGTYYPEAPIREAAQPVTVSPGAEAQADFTLRTARGLRVSFTTDPPLPNVMATASPLDSNTDRTPVELDPSRRHVFFGTTGTWKITANAFTPNRGPDDPPLYGEMQIQLADSDIDNLKIPVNKMSDIPINISGDTTQPLFLQLRDLQLRDKTGNISAGSEPAQDGTSRIRNVPPGSYRVALLSPGGNSCVTALTSGSQDLLREELVISPGSNPAPIQVVESSNCAQLSITVNSTSNATILLTTDSKSFEPRQLSTTQTAAVQVSGLSPGDYKVYAFDDINNLEYANPEALREFKSQSVHLDAGQKATIQIELNQRQAQ